MHDEEAVRWGRGGDLGGGGARTGKAEWVPPLLKGVVRAGGFEGLAPGTIHREGEPIP